ncbi:MAG: AAA family ATPase [Ignavibacteria bacterium]|nr:AAA family ATPase [Ignavibacteria bacterium]
MANSTVLFHLFCKIGGGFMSRKNGKQAQNSTQTQDAQRLSKTKTIPLHKRIIARAFNPDQLTPEERNALFVVRKPLFERIYKDIVLHPSDALPQHWLILGVRGSGKTTLLLKIYDELCADTEAQKRIVAVRLNEEQHGIFKLSRLWEKVLEILQDEAGKEWSGVYDEAEKHFNDEEYEERAFEYLIKPLRERRKNLVLMIDNFGVMLDKFSIKEHQHLRSLLLTCPEIRIIAASANALEHTYRYDKPFFDFFAIVQLKGLKLAETIELLTTLAAHRSEEERANVMNIIEKQPRRIEVLRTLTGGFPRTLVLLFDIFTDSTGGDSVQDLERLLDHVTPFYGQRVEDLSSHQRVVVDAVALAWDAVSVKELVAKTRMESKSISSQLNELEKQGIIEKVPTSTKNNFYRLQERFFNIWYLMRNGRKNDKQRVIWFVRFIESFFPEEMLNVKAVQIIQGLKNGDELYPNYIYFMGEALAQTGKLNEILQHELLQEVKNYLLVNNSPLVHSLSLSDKELLSEVIIISEGGKFFEKEINLRRIGLLQEIKSEKLRIKVIPVLALSYILVENYKLAESLLLEAIRYGEYHSNHSIELYLSLYLSGKLKLQKKNLHRIFNLLSSLSEHKYSPEESLFFLYYHSINNNLENISPYIEAVVSIESTDFVHKENWFAITSITSSIILKLLIDKQYQSAIRLFQNDELKESIKILWYVTLHFVKEQYPDEYLRMGSEFSDKTQQIIQIIENVHIDFSQNQGVLEIEANNRGITITLQHSP